MYLSACSLVALRTLARRKWLAADNHIDSVSAWNTLQNMLWLAEKLGKIVATCFGPPSGCVLSRSSFNHYRNNLDSPCFTLALAISILISIAITYNMLLNLPLELQQMSLDKHELLVLRATCHHLDRLCHQDITKKIIDEMRDDNITTTYLYKSVEHQRHGFLQRLLSLQPPLDQTDAAGETALHKAVRRNCLFCVQHLLGAGANPSFATTQGWSSLMLAARYDHVALANELLQAGAEVNAQGFHGWTALHLAHTYGYADMSRVLAYAGADQNIADNDGVKAKEASCGNKCWGVWR
ncbi:ankyrin repeat-containing domain protein [Dactylonectria macrodidyma]|uniref:Ankyrin repeat-containing domain protein n=1 Tax=Dactylonectria macrodidyma TaxID=307937 RepID=A0A9P9DL83_9HYPO|nr:ankyrin repeat-containing domain protein [Dactylonectria macrodidyma]